MAKNERREFLQESLKVGGMAGLAALALTVPSRADGGKVEKSPAGMKVGNLVFTSGLTAPGGTIEEQTRAILEKQKKNLEAAGSSLENVLKVGVYMSDIRNEKPGMNKAYAEYFRDHKPSRTAVGVDFPDDATKVEIEMIAWVP